jgi:transposase
MSLYAKRLEKGRFVWPQAKEGVVALSHAQLACLLDGIDWQGPAVQLAAAERRRRLLDQLKLQLEELEASASEDDLAAEQAAVKTTSVAAFSRKRPAKKPFPEHLPRERVVIPPPCSCPSCGGTRLSKLGEDVTERLE